MSVWRVPAYLPYVHAPLTDETVKAAEAELGVTLAGILSRTAARTERGLFALQVAEIHSRAAVGHGEGYPNILEQRVWLDLDEAEQPKGGELLVPFDGDGHWYMCLDYRAPRPHAEPTVSYIDVEIGEQSPIAPTLLPFVRCGWRSICCQLGV